MKEFRGNSSRHTGSWTSENEHTFARVLSVDFSIFGCCLPAAYKQMSWITLFSSYCRQISASPQFVCSQLPFNICKITRGNTADYDNVSVNHWLTFITMIAKYHSEVLDSSKPKCQNMNCFWRFRLHQ